VIKDSNLELHFPVLHQYWMDSGLLGFYSLAKRAQRNFPDISLRADDSGVYLTGTDSQLKIFLDTVLESLLDEYYNTSTPKQIEENTGFYYDTEKDEFVRFPKVKSRGIAGIILDHAPSATRDKTAYVKTKAGATRKNQLPEAYADLQDRLDAFLEENKLKADGATFYINGRNAYRANVTISPTPKKAKTTCYLCGRDTHAVSKVSGTVLPLITGSSGIKSFNSGCESPFSVCWMCDYIGKFVPVPGYYLMKRDDTFIFLIYSQSFEKMVHVFAPFNSAKKYDDTRSRNFGSDLGGYFEKPYEQFFSFMYTLYLNTFTVNPKGEKESEIDYDALCNLNIAKAPVSFYVLQFQKLGDPYIGKLIWNFTEAVYLFRLFAALFERKIDIIKVMQGFVDYGQTKNECKTTEQKSNSKDRSESKIKQKDESKTIVRNRICEAILKKQHITDLVEPFVYHINRSEKKIIKPAFDFVEAYEHILYEGDTMKQELIDTAVSLGKTIGLKLGTEDEKNRGKKARGDLFRLRRARKPEDFLNEVNRIQMKYDASVTADLYNKGEAFDENFTEFKQFCMIAALNSYNAKTSDKPASGE